MFFSTIRSLETSLPPAVRLIRGNHIRTARQQLRGETGRYGFRHWRKNTTPTINKDMYAYIFSQQGLMVGLGVQGNKLTRLEP